MLVLPALLLAALLLLQVAALGCEQVAAQGLAAQVARGAVVGADPSDLTRAVAPDAGARLRITRGRVPGDPAEWVRVEVRVRSRAFRRLGVDLDIVGRAAARRQ